MELLRVVFKFLGRQENFFDKISASIMVVIILNCSVQHITVFYLTL
jgi:hypothetical protein